MQGLLNTALYIAFNVLFLICRERLWRQLRPAPRAAPWRQMLAYCVPLIPTAVFWWIMGVSDRYLVKWFVGSDANGIYAVAYKIPTILTILATVFMDAWQLSAIAESGDRRAQARFYARVGRVLLRGLPLRGRHHRVFAAAHPAARGGELPCPRPSARRF